MESPTEHAAEIFQEPEPLPNISPEAAKRAIIRKFKEVAGFEETAAGVDFIQDSETKDILDAIEYWLSKTEEGFQTSSTSGKISPADHLNLVKCGWLVRRMAKYKMTEETRTHVEELYRVCIALFLFFKKTLNQTP